MEEILHQLLHGSPHYSKDFNHPFGGAEFLPSTVSSIGLIVGVFVFSPCGKVVEPGLETKSPLIAFLHPIGSGEQHMI